MAPWGRKGERWLGCCTALSPATPSHSPPPHTHRGALSTPGSFGTSDTSRTLGRGRKQVRKHAGGGCNMPARRCPKFPGDTDTHRVQPPFWGAPAVPTCGPGAPEGPWGPGAPASPFCPGSPCSPLAPGCPSAPCREAAAVSGLSRRWIRAGGNGAKYSPGGQQIRRDQGHRVRPARPAGERWGLNGGRGTWGERGQLWQLGGCGGMALTGAPRAPAAPDGPGGPDSPWKRKDGELWGGGWHLPQSEAAEGLPGLSPSRRWGQRGRGDRWDPSDPKEERQMRTRPPRASLAGHPAPAASLSHLRVRRPFQGLPRGPSLRRLPAG